MESRVRTVIFARMNMNRRNFLLSTAALALSGCTTASLLKESTEDTVDYQREKVSGFFASVDGKKLVVLGTDYHYVMDQIGDLPQVLQSPLKPRLNAEFSYFDLDHDNHVFGQVTLQLKGKVSDAERQQLQMEGFECKGFQEEVWTKVYKVRGTRYLAKGFELPASVSKFNHDYEIIVRESHSPGVKRAMVLLTPVTLAMDGVLVLGGIVLAPVALIVLSNTHWR